MSIAIADGPASNKPEPVKQTPVKQTIDKPPVASEKVAAPADIFAQSLRPFLARHCYECPSGKEPKGSLDLKEFRGAAAVGKDRDTWAKIVEYLEGDVMPPEEQPRPKDRTSKQSQVG